jgi:hypothetical protein
VFRGQVRVRLGERIPLLGNFLFRENRIDRALWLAGAAVNAFVWVDEHGQLEGARLGLRFVDALNRANVHTSLILGVDAGFGNDVGHDRNWDRGLEWPPSLFNSRAIEEVKRFPDSSRSILTAPP